MKRFRSKHLIVLCLLAVSGSSGCAGAERRNAAGTPAEVSAPLYCAATDKVVFSCPLAGRKTIVSLCASESGGHTPAFHYVYGRPPRADLIFPSEGTPTAGRFKRTHLLYAGATGGTAYSFVTGGHKYIVYSISGTGLREGGVLMQRVGETHAVRDLKCQAGAISETESEAIIGATMKWEADPQLQAAGLPHVKK